MSPSRRGRSRPLVAVAVAVAALVAVALSAAGCGLGSGGTPSQTELRVSRDFGTQPLLDTDHPKISGADTVMRLLQRNVKRVTTRYGGGFVQSIDGLAGAQRGGRSYDWFFYVNGIVAGKGAAAVKVHDGDRVWWDYHDWTLTDRIPAVVGSFPEPFLHGVDGRRLPIRVECVTDDANCTTVQNKLVALGLPAAKGGIGTSYVEDTLRILVGPWPALHRDPTAKLVDQGPTRSGVFATFGDDGKRLALYDARGHVARTLGPGSGLIAATKALDEIGEPVWFVTGTDARGIAAAAQALDEGALAGRFAAAIVGGRPVSLPYVTP